jgi:hypothetical protein
MIFRRARKLVFILGCQRSGTTICQNVFLASRRFEVFREGNKKAMTDNWRLKDDETIRALAAASRRPVLLFKPINDSQSADRLLRDFPGSRIVWIWRDVFDTANSAVAKWGDSQLDMVTHIARAFAESPDRPAAMARIEERPNYGIYAERIGDDAIAALMAWQELSLSPHAGAAALWWLRNRLYFDLGLAGDPRVLLVKYEDFVQSPRTQISRLCEFMDERCSERLAEGVHTGSLRKSAPPELPAPLAEACAELDVRLAAEYASQLAPTRPAGKRA